MGGTVKHQLYKIKKWNRVVMTAALFLGLLLASGCTAAREEPDPPLFENALTFDIVTTENGWHLIFGVPGNEDPQAPVLYHTWSEDRGVTWSTAVPLSIDHAPPGRHNRGNDVQLAARGDKLFAVWTARGDGPWGSGPLAMAFSLDRGETWTAGPAPTPASPAESEAGFRFPAITADDECLHAIWIHALGDERSLRYSRLNFDTMRWSDPLTVDPTICACCWNELAIAPDGAVVALYRDHNPSDMALATSHDQGQTWIKNGHVGAFDWQFEGCPHVGGSLVLQPGDSSPVILASVWSGHPDHTDAYIFQSTDGGRYWELSRRLPAGRNTDLAAFSSGAVIAVWDRLENGTQSVFQSTYSPDTGSWSDAVRVSPDGVRSTHPRLVTADGSALILWSTESEDGSPKIKTALIDRPSRR